MSEKTKAEQLKDLQQLQISGEAKTIKANQNDKYDIPEASKDRIHLSLTRKVLNPAAKTFDLQEKIMAVDARDFEQLDKTNAFHQAAWENVEIIHDPRPKTEKKAADKKEAK